MFVNIFVNIINGTTQEDIFTYKKAIHLPSQYTTSKSAHTCLRVTSLCKLLFSTNLEMVMEIHVYCKL